MEDKNYSGKYAIQISLTDTAWSNENYKKRIEEGELIKIIMESEGVETCWKGPQRYQNVPLINNAKNTFALMEKLNELPYVRELNLLKDGLISRGGYIPVKNKESDKALNL